MNKSLPWIYLLLAILGAILPWQANLEFMQMNPGGGFDLQTFIQDANINAASRSLNRDLLIAATALAEAPKGVEGSGPSIHSPYEQCSHNRCFFAIRHGWICSVPCHDWSMPSLAQHSNIGQSKSQHPPSKPTR